MPCEGNCLDELPRKEIRLRTILGREDVEEFMKIEAKNLSVEMRLLHHMVSRIFFPRGRRYDLMTGRDICLMHHIVSESLLNLPFFMIDAMREALNKSKVPLPYGMALTVIFRESGVSFEGEEVVCRISNTDTYNDHSLQRMGFIRVDGHWTKG